MKIYQSRSFEKRVKRFTPQQKKALDGAIKEILKDPAVGIEKKGDLKGIFIYKFKLNDQLYLLAYRIIAADALELIMIGPHENYYRDLKKHTKRN